MSEIGQKLALPVRREDFAKWMYWLYYNSEAKMYEIYQKYKASDGFLYLKYAEMERFWWYSLSFTIQQQMYKSERRFGEYPFVQVQTNCIVWFYTVAEEAFHEAMRPEGLFDITLS